MRISNLQYLLCELNDENYTEPTFTVFNSHESAFKQAVERCTGVAYYYESDFELECKDNLNRISITFNKSPYGEDNNFYTTEIKEYDSAKGNYVLVWHHAYNGVGFDVELVGTYEECKQNQYIEHNQKVAGRKVGIVRNYTGDGLLHRWRKCNLKELLEDYKEV